MSEQWIKISIYILGKLGLNRILPNTIGYYENIKELIRKVMIVFICYIMILCVTYTPNIKDTETETFDNVNKYAGNSSYELSDGLVPVSEDVAELYASGNELNMQGSGTINRLLLLEIINHTQTYIINSGFVKVEEATKYSGEDLDATMHDLRVAMERQAYYDEVMSTAEIEEIKESWKELSDKIKNTYDKIVIDYRNGKIDNEYKINYKEVESKLEEFSDLVMEQFGQ